MRIVTPVTKPWWLLGLVFYQKQVLYKRGKKLYTLHHNLSGGKLLHFVPVKETGIKHCTFSGMHPVHAPKTENSKFISPTTKQQQPPQFIKCHHLLLLHDTPDHLPEPTASQDVSIWTEILILCNTVIFEGVFLWFHFLSSWEWNLSWKPRTRGSVVSYPFPPLKISSLNCFDSLQGNTYLYWAK